MANKKVKEYRKVFDRKILRNRLRKETIGGNKALRNAWNFLKQGEKDGNSKA